MKAPTERDIQLRPAGPHEYNTDGKRALWRWICPGCGGDVSAYEGEPWVSEAAILRDPLCCYCRRERGKQ